MGEPIDVAVVGAGVAGLVAARELRRRGHRVVVLEARDHVGGRVDGVPNPHGGTLELGGEFLGPGEDRTYALLDELGLHAVHTHDAGRQVLEAAPGLIRRYSGAIPRLNPLALVDVALIQRRFDRLTRTVDTEAPWRTPGAAELDATTVASWVRRVAWTRAGREMFEFLCTALWSAQPDEFSLLHALFYAGAAGGLSKLVEIEGGSLQDHVVEGAHRIPVLIAEQLADAVHTGDPVRTIEVRDGDALLTTWSGTTWTARRVVVAVPPAQAARITYDPPLPADRDALTQRMPMGAVIKVLVVYDRPFWRRDGLSGHATSVVGPISATLDTSPADGSLGVLSCYVEGGTARRCARMEPAERRAEMLDALGRLFGDRAREPLHYLEHDWTREPFVRGGYGGLFGPGTWTRLGHALREPVGPLHWAGAETSSVYCGYIEGAVRSGERAAAEIDRVLASAAAAPTA